MKDEKHAGGRPRKYGSPEEMQAAIDKYFSDCPDTTSVFAGGEAGMLEVPCPTITGLSLYLGFCDRQSMYDYEDRAEFSDTIKKARTRMELEYEKDLRFGRNTSGSIFALKNFGWADKKEVTLESTATVKLEDLNERIAAIATDDEGE